MVMGDWLLEGKRRGKENSEIGNKSKWESGGVGQIRKGVEEEMERGRKRELKHSWKINEWMEDEMKGEEIRTAEQKKEGYDNTVMRTSQDVQAEAER